jgi:hypothetical protein
LPYIEALERDLVEQDDWDKETVVRQLSEQADERGVVSAQVFLGPSFNVSPDAVRELVSAAAGAVGARQDRLTVGRLRPLARAFALQAEPLVLAELARNADVVSILPQKIEDIHPRPVSRRAVGS